jgi:hypothetical protein
VNALGLSVDFACTEPRLNLSEDAVAALGYQEHPTTALLAQGFPAEIMIEEIDD